MGNAARGRELVASTGTYQQDKMIDSLDVIAWLEQERLAVARRGQCSGGCDHTSDVSHFATGRPVCPRTLQACQKRELQPLIDLYASL